MTALLGLTLAACSAGTNADLFTDSTDMDSAPISPPAGMPAAPPSNSPVAATPPPLVTAPTPEAPAAAPAPLACIAGEPPAPGCVTTHDLTVNALSGAIFTCGAENQASNGCHGTPVRLDFVEESDAAPQSVTIAFDTGFFCAKGNDVTQTVALNGMPVGTFYGNEADCSCQAESRAHVVTLRGDDLRHFKVADVNTILIGGTNHCLALRPKSGTYARVVVGH